MKIVNPKNGTPVVLWLTGISGAGKTTIANELTSHFDRSLRPSILLDGDEVRKGLNSDLGFDNASRSESARRLGEVAKLFVGRGFTVIVAAISPLQKHRTIAQQCIGPDQFLEIHIHAPIQVAMSRDPKGIYRRALRGEIKDVSGLDAIYEAPRQPMLRIDTESVSVDDATQLIASLVGEYAEPGAEDSHKRYLWGSIHSPLPNDADISAPYCSSSPYTGDQSHESL